MEDKPQNNPQNNRQANPQTIPRNGAHVCRPEKKLTHEEYARLRRLKQAGAPPDRRASPKRPRPPRFTARPAVPVAQSAPTAPTGVFEPTGAGLSEATTRRDPTYVSDARRARSNPGVDSHGLHRSGWAKLLRAPYRLIGAVTVAAAVLVIVLIALFAGGASNAARADAGSAPNSIDSPHTKAVFNTETTAKTDGALNGESAVICIDPGHGYDDPGAVYEPTMGELTEEDLTLDVSLRLAELLRAAGFTVIMTRADDEIPADGDGPGQYTLDPFERVDFVREHPETDLFISLHCDAFAENTAIGGTRIYTYSGGVAGTEEYAGALAVSLGNALSITVPVISKNMAEAYYVTKMLPVPSILIEMGFITNAGDAVNLLSDEWRDAFAAGAVKGIEDYIGSRS